MTVSLPTRTFGIELEVILPFGLSMTGLADLISAAGVRCTAPGYSHRVAASWRVVPDGSVQNGCEIVSPILKGERGIEAARKVADAIKAAGCTVNVHCGFHVHVGAADFTAKQLGTAALTYIWFETFFDQIMPASRRATNNIYIKSNRGRFGGYGTDAVNAAFARAAAEPVTTEYEALRLATGGSTSDRYFKLNLASFLPIDGRPGYQTVEFRQHSGTVDADKIENWVRLCVAFVDKAKTARPRPRTVTRDLTSLEEMHLFFSVFQLPASVKTFYRLRRKELAAADRKAERQAARQAA